MSDLDADERRLADLFATVDAPQSLRGRWVSGRGGAGAEAVRGGPGRRAGRALVAALIGSRGERRLRPLAAALVLPVAVLGVAGAVQLRAHFTSTLAGTPGNPPARAQAAMAYDPNLGVVVMFGGRGGSGSLDDTWTWDGSTWRRQHTAVAPAARAGATMGYDKSTGRMVLFGGMPDRGAENDTWTWDGTTWRPESPPHSPQGIGQMALAGMAADPATGQLVLVAPLAKVPPGMQGSVSTLLAPWPVGVPAGPVTSPGTSPLAGSARPLPVISAGHGPAAIPVPVQAPFTSEDYEYGTWTWTGSDWAAVAGANRPAGALVTPSIAYDASIGKLMLVTASTPSCTSAGMAAGAAGGAGSAASTLQCTVLASDPVRWTWDGRSWTKDPSPMQKLGFPSLLATAPGGWLSFQHGSTVTGAGSRPATHPATPRLRYRSAPALSGDDARHQVVLFGGSVGGRGMTADTWVWDGTAWTQRGGPVEPVPTPVPVSRPSAASPPPPAAMVPCAASSATPTVVDLRRGDGAVRITVDVPQTGCAEVAAAELADSHGVPLRIDGNPSKLSLQGTVALEWSNWCAGPTPAALSLTWPGHVLRHSLSGVPSCLDRSQPSRLTVTVSVVIP
ncbi:MAG TPA: hypothetical protein VGQ42_14470 [Candidatus Dormibacteraeota bacterium]|jgi:hypothetical protein|nr:hypothetical protein [Candidatus Dormibacteraeota bacterium]